MTNGKVIREWFNESESCWSERNDMAETNLNYFYGQQWDSEILDKLKEEKRPALTINIIKPILKLVSGLMIENSLDSLVLPEEGGDKLVADILSHIIKWVGQKNNIDSLDSMYYLMGMICDRSYLSFDIDYISDPLNGEIKIRLEDPRDIYPDPNFREYDHSDCEFLCRVRWMTKNKIKSLYKNRAKDIIFDEINDKFPLDIYKTVAITSEAAKRYRIIECFWKDYQEIKYLVNEKIGFIEPIERGNVLINNQKIPVNEFAQSIGMDVEDFKETKIIKPVIKLTTIAGDQVLLDGDSPFNNHPYTAVNYPIIGFYPLFIMGNSSGLVGDLIDVQNEKNKRRSQLLHLINLAANSGWVQTEGALEDPDILKKFGATPGVVIKLKKGRQYGSDLVRLQPASVPGYVENVDFQQSTSAKEVTGVNPDMLGMSEKTVSGRAISLRQRQGMIILSNETNNFITSKRLFSKYLIGLIQANMSIEQVFRITGIDEQKIQQNPDIYEKIKSFDTGKYDVVVSEAQKSPSYRFANFQTTMDLYQTLGPEVVPPDVLIEASDVPGKEKIIERLRQGAQPQGEVAGHPTGQGMPANMQPSEDMGTNPRTEQAETVPPGFAKQ